jgi:hypothetical protein
VTGYGCAVIAREPAPRIQFPSPPVAEERRDPVAEQTAPERCVGVDYGFFLMIEQSVFHISIITMQDRYHEARKNKKKRQSSSAANDILAIPY